MRSDERLAETLARHVERGELPGLVWMVSRRGKVESGAIGAMAVGGAEPMRRDALFRITSMTKPVTAAAAMILVDEGKVALDEPVDRLLPELANRRVLRRVDGPLDDTVPAARAITVRDLLTFRMGFGILWRPTDATPIQRAAEELKLGAFGPPRPAVPPPPDEWIRRFATLPLMYQPGERWMYNTGSEVLGILVARAAGMSFEQFLRQRIFEPLGMKDTSFSVRTSDLHRLPPAYLARDPFHPDGSGLDTFDGVDDSQWARPPAFPSGGGGLVSTADDYLAFANMLLGGGSVGSIRILSRASVDAMTTDQITAEEKARSEMLPHGWWNGHGWGLGMSVTTAARDPRGPGGFGWDGGFGTYWAADPRENMTAILMTQRVAFPPMTRIYGDFWSEVYRDTR
ncbi:MAG TPA: serine hydrolase domain-containing protein [Polyangiaceae bacterium]